MKNSKGPLSEHRVERELVVRACWPNAADGQVRPADARRILEHRIAPDCDIGRAPAVLEGTSSHATFSWASSGLDSAARAPRRPIWRAGGPRAHMGEELSLGGICAFSGAVAG
jgi:hypothetical protein